MSRLLASIGVHIGYVQSTLWGTQDTLTDSRHKANQPVKTFHVNRLLPLLIAGMSGDDAVSFLERRRTAIKQHSSHNRVWAAYVKFRKKGEYLARVRPGFVIKSFKEFREEFLYAEYLQEEVSGMTRADIIAMARKRETMRQKKKRAEVVTARRVKKIAASAGILIPD